MKGCGMCVLQPRLRLTLGWSQFTKVHNYVNIVGGVLFTFSDDVLYLNQISKKYLKGFQSY